MNMTKEERLIKCDGMFDIINERLKLEKRKKSEAKRCFKTSWHTDNLTFQLSVLLYEEIITNKDNSEIDIFTKVINDKNIETIELKKSLDRYENQISSFKEEIKSQKTILSTERSNYKEQLQSKDLSNTSENDSIESLKQTTKRYENIIQSRNTKITELENEISILNKDIDEEKQFTMALRRRGLTETEPLQSNTVILQGAVVEDSKFTKYVKIISNKFKRKEHRE